MLLAPCACASKEEDPSAGFSLVASVGAGPKQQELNRHQAEASWGYLRAKCRVVEERGGGIHLRLDRQHHRACVYSSGRRGLVGLAHVWVTLLASNSQDKGGRVALQRRRKLAKASLVAR